MGGPNGMLATHAFLPLTKGAVDSANPSLGLDGAVRYVRNAIVSGINKVSIRPGAVVALTLLDDQGTPAPITKVCHVGPFADGAVAVGYSSVTNKVYLYRVDASFTGYYNTSGTFTASTTARPIAVVWSSLTAVPDVSVTEGLGTLYIAHTVASDSNGLYWPTKTYTDFSGSVTSLPASGTDGSASGTDTAYFNGVIAYQQALWGWGYGAGSTAATGFRPEMARFSPPSFGNLQLADSITVGDRVRSQRERIVGAGLAGEVLILGASSFVTQVTGYGRDSWYKKSLDRSYGFVGPKCMVSAGDSLYYWSRRGPMRIEGTGDPEPLWDAIPSFISSVVNASHIVAAFDPDRDQVLFMADIGSGLRTFAAFDIRRNIFLGPDSDFGVSVACANVIEPYTASTASPPSGPSGPPTDASTTAVGQATATANWTAGDIAAQTLIQYRFQGATTWNTATTAAAGVTSYTFTGLTSATAYEWRATHVLNGQSSTSLGPSSSTQFTTTAPASGGTLQPPTNLSATSQYPPMMAVVLYWTNSGESGVTTEIWSSSDGSNFNLIDNAASGQSSRPETVSDFGTWTFKVRHVRISDAATSDFSATASAQIGNAE